MQLSPLHLYIPQGLSDGFRVVTAVSPWLSLVILGFPWLSVVILSYTWLSWLLLVILGYAWLSTVQIYVKSFAHLQFSFRPSAEIFCSRGLIK